MSKLNLEILLNAMIDLAKDELVKNGVLVPFSCSLRDGKIEVQMALTDQKDIPTKKLITLLKNGLKELSKDFLVDVLAVCVDVSLHGFKSGNALLLQIEGRDGTSVVAQLPYRVNDNKKVEFGEIEFANGVRELFAI